MITALKVAFRLRRFEIISLLALTATATVAALVVAAMLRGMPQPADCYLDATGRPSDGAGCPSAAEFMELSQGLAGTIMAAIGTLPFVIGAVLGVTIVARDVEHRTAPFAWSFQPARARWLLELVGLLGGLTAAMLVPLIVSSLVLQTERFPGLDPAGSFFDYGNQGPVMLVRALAAFSVALIAGALIGRVLPALLVAAIASAVLFTVLPTIGLIGRPLETVSEDSVNHGALYVDTGYMTDDGRLLRPPEAYAQAPGNLDLGDKADWVETHFKFVRLGLRGERLVSVQAQEAAVLAVLTSALVVGAVVVVQRRRPY